MTKNDGEGSTPIAATQNAPQYTTDPGPIEGRSCRDVIFLIIFIIFWVGMFVIAGFAFTKGDVNRLKYGLDVNGDLCGVGKFADSPFLFYFVYPNDDVETAYRRCIPACPQQATPICKYGVDYSVLRLGTDCYPGYASSPVLNRCIPTSADALANSVNPQFAALLNNRPAVSQIFDALATNWKWILLCSGVALILSFLWLILIKIFAGFVVWFSVIMSIVLTFGCAGYWGYLAYTVKTGRPFTFDGESIPIPDPLKGLADVQNFNILVSIAAISGFVAVFLLLLIIGARQRINLAIEVIREATLALRAMPFIVFFPIWKYIAQGILFGWVLLIWAFLATSGQAIAATVIANTEKYTSINFEPDNVIQNLSIYYLFGLFWTWNLIIAIGQCTMAGAVATWYWTRDKKALPKSMVLRSLGRVFRYHLGSLAFGSLIIAIIQLIRFFIEQLDRRLRGSQNKIAIYILKCLKCVFYCIEKFLRFLNKNAYIEIAVYGYSFCQAAKTAFELLLRNAFRVIVLDRVGSFVLFLGKLTITMATGIVGAGLLQRYAEPGENLSIPLLVIVVLAFVIATCFLSVLDMTIDTIFLCFCEDCERNDGSPSKPYYMSESLRKFTSKHAEPAQGVAAGIQDATQATKV